MSVTHVDNYIFIMTVHKKNVFVAKKKDTKNSKYDKNLKKKNEWIIRLKL